jgi:steroid delta-isomerase-like uncharacterized protein
VSRRNSEAVRQLVECWNRHDSVAAVGLLAEEVEYWDVTQPAAFHGRAEVQAFFQSFFDAFPNLRFEIRSLFGAGDHVACEWRMQGTQEKELAGINAVGKSIDIEGASICTFVKDSIARQVDYWDGGTMMRQLGLST